MSRRKLSILPYQARRILLKTIERFLKATDKVEVILNIAVRLFHVDFFLQIPMEEGGFDIHLMDLPFM
jgi:hypothetical protein